MERKSNPPKTRWHPLSLQSLSPPKFSSVVDRILKGDYSVITSRARHSGKRILVTDDNADHTEAIVEFLETDLGVVVDTARSPVECLRKVQAESYDLLIIDYRLPKHDGLFVIDQLCRAGRHVPVLMMTSFYSKALSDRISRDYTVEIMAKADSLRLIARRAGYLLSSTGASPMAQRLAG